MHLRYSPGLPRVRANACIALVSVAAEFRQGGEPAASLGQPDPAQPVDKAGLECEEVDVLPGVSGWFNIREDGIRTEVSLTQKVARRVLVVHSPPRLFKHRLGR